MSAALQSQFAGARRTRQLHSRNDMQSGVDIDGVAGHAGRDAADEEGDDAPDLGDIDEAMGGRRAGARPCSVNWQNSERRSG